MENENLENVNSQNDTEGTVNSNEEGSANDSTEETSLEAEVKKATATLYARMKNAEEVAKKLKEELSSKLTSKSEAKVYQGGLTTKDIFVLVDAKVPQDDIDEVVEYANFKKISVAEALKTPTIKSMLGEKAEQRNTALASNTKSSARGSGRITDEQLLENARKGKMPESEEDLARLFRARKAK